MKLSIWLKKITIKKLIIATILSVAMITSMVSGFFALGEIYRQKSRDTWALVFLELERAAIALSDSLANLDTNSTSDLPRSVYRIVTEDKMSLTHVSGKILPVDSFSDLGLSGANLTDETIAHITSINGQAFIVKSIGKFQIALYALNFSRLLPVPSSLSSDSIILLVNKSEKLVYSANRLPRGWMKRPLIQKFIQSPLSQGQFEYRNEKDELIHGFFQSISGSNLLLFVEIPLSTILATIIDPSKRFAITALLVIILALLITWLPMRLLTSPVNNLKEIARQVGEGNFRVVAKSAIGEFGELSRAFVLMGENLHKRDIQLKRLMEEEKEKVRLAAELKVASSIQMNLLPQSELAIESGLLLNSFYKPATEVSGDWFGYHYDPYSENSIVILVDVSGHGAAPGMLTAIIASLFAEICRRVDYDSVHQFFESANRALYKFGAKKWHATALAVLFHGNHEKITIVNAGHQPPILNLKGEKAKSHAFGSDPLGVEQDFSLSEKEFQFTQGSQLFLFTDGLVEATNIDEKQYGRKKVLRSINQELGHSVPQIVRRIMADWKHYRGNVIAEDDTCVLGIEAL